MSIRNMEYLRGKDNRLYEALVDLQSQVQTLQKQTNSGSSQSSQPAAPPAINHVHVSTGPGGEFQIAITDNSPINRGINYWAEHADNPQFTNPHIIDMGQSRNHSVYMGSQKLYWRAYSSYPGSDASVSVYHGNAAQPAAVQGGVPGLRAPSQGAGTGAAAQGTYGPGPVPTRQGAVGFNWTAQGKSVVR